jgi:branched-chain amino acid transport system ATP-binding protein
MEIPLLEIRNLVINYGHIQAIKGIDLKIYEGEITSLVGANGAGKTTSLLGISKILKLTKGQIFFQGKEITNLKPHEIVKLGIVHVPEGREILNFLTVLENLELGAYSRKDKTGISNDLNWVLSLFPILKDRASAMAGNLSGGEQQMLAIARGLMAKPKLLLLDEPSMGLAPLITEEIFRVLTEINKTGITILLVEQNIRHALKISKHGYVMETGRIVLFDTSKNLLVDPKVIDAYLGS